MDNLKKAGRLNLIALACLALGMLSMVLGTLYNPVSVEGPPFDWTGLSFKSANKYEIVVNSSPVTFEDRLSGWAEEFASSVYRLGLLPEDMLRRIANGDNNDPQRNGVSVHDFTELIGKAGEYFARTPADYSSMAEYLRNQLASDYIVLSSEQHELTRTEAAQVILSALSITGEDWGSISPEDISRSQMPDDVTRNAINRIQESDIMIGYDDGNFGNSLRHKFTLDEAVTATYNYYRYKVRQSGGYDAA